MGYFRSLMKQSGLGRVTAGQRRSLAIDVEETRTVKRRRSNKLDPPPKAAPPQIAMPNAPEVRHTSVPIVRGPTAEKTRKTFAGTAGVELDAGSRAACCSNRSTGESRADAHAPSGYLRRRKGMGRGTASQRSASDCPRRLYVPDENVSVAWPVPHPVEIADHVTVEIGAIQIVIEEPRPGLVAPQPAAAKQTQVPSQSWTLASRHYLRP